MVCDNCGKEFEDDRLFCPVCGVRVSKSEQANAEEENITVKEDVESKTERKRMKKSSKTILTFFSSFVLIAVLIWFFGGESVIRLFKGPEGYFSHVVDNNSEAFASESAGSIENLKKIYKGMLSDKKRYEQEGLESFIPDEISIEKEIISNVEEEFKAIDEQKCLSVISDMPDESEIVYFYKRYARIMSEKTEYVIENEERITLNNSIVKCVALTVPLKHDKNKQMTEFMYNQLKKDNTFKKLINGFVMSHPSAHLIEKYTGISINEENFFDTMCHIIKEADELKLWVDDGGKVIGWRINSAAFEYTSYDTYEYYEKNFVIRTASMCKVLKSTNVADVSFPIDVGIVINISGTFHETQEEFKGIHNIKLMGEECFGIVATTDRSSNVTASEIITKPGIISLTDRLESYTNSKFDKDAIQYLIENPIKFSSRQ